MNKRIWVIFLVVSLIAIASILLRLIARVLLVQSQESDSILVASPLAQTLEVCLLVGWLSIVVFFWRKRQKQ